MAKGLGLTNLVVWFCSGLIPQWRRSHLRLGQNREASPEVEGPDRVLPLGLHWEAWPVQLVLPVGASTATAWAL